MNEKHLQETTWISNMNNKWSSGQLPIGKHLHLNRRLLEPRSRLGEESLKAPLPLKKLQSSAFANLDFQERGEIHNRCAHHGHTSS